MRLGGWSWISSVAGATPAAGLHLCTLLADADGTALSGELQGSRPGDSPRRTGLTGFGLTGFCRVHDTSQ